MGVKLVLLDMDGTLTTVTSPWQYVHEQLGIWEAKGLPLLNSWLEGDISYETFCIEDARAWSDHGLNLEQVYEILATIPVPPQTDAFLSNLHRQGINIAIISTGFSYNAGVIMERAGIPVKEVAIAANELAENDGEIVPALNVVAGDGAGGKAAWSRRMMELHGAAPAETGAVGDSSADIPMFESVEHHFKVSGPKDLPDIPWLPTKPQP